MTDVMFDLETLDTKPTAVILSLGAVKFDPARLGVAADAPRLKMRIDIDAQSVFGRTISDSTMEWWSKQDPAIQEEAFSDTDRIPLEEALDQFHKFVWNSERVWSQGSFDVNIMENLYGMLNRPLAWQYWQVRDSRTLFDFVDGKLDRSNHHDAMEDAVAQAEAVQRALKKIGWTGQKL